MPAPAHRQRVLGPGANHIRLPHTYIYGYVCNIRSSYVCKITNIRFCPSLVIHHGPTWASLTQAHVVARPSPLSVSRMHVHTCVQGVSTQVHACRCGFCCIANGTSWHLKEGWRVLGRRDITKIYFSAWFSSAATMKQTQHLS
jgi:hypothetical protein